MFHHVPKLSELQDEADKLLGCVLVVVNEVISCFCMALTLLEVDAALCKQDLGVQPLRKHPVSHWVVLHSSTVQTYCLLFVFIHVQQYYIWMLFTKYTHILYVFNLVAV